MIIRTSIRWPIGPTPMNFWNYSHSAIMKNTKTVKACEYCEGAHWIGICDAGARAEKDGKKKKRKPKPSNDTQP